MDTGTPPPVIDTGAAPEIYSDDLGKIEVMENTICWHYIRQHDGERVAVVKVITPISAIPSIAGQIVAAFANMLSGQIKSALFNIVDQRRH